MKRLNLSNLKPYLDKLHDKRRILLSLSVLVVFITTYMLILPAFTLDKDEAAAQGGIDVAATEEAAVTEETADAEESADLEDDSDDDITDRESIDSDKSGNEEKTDPDTDDATNNQEVASENAKIGSEPGLNYEGAGYRVEIIDETGALPEGTELSVEEIDQGHDDFEGLYEDAVAAIRDDEGKKKAASYTQARFFDITLSKDGKKIEPKESISVRISFDDAVPVENDKKIRIVHFAEDQETGEVIPEVLDKKSVEVTVEEKALTETTFEASSFSRYGIISQGQTTDLDGKTFAIINTNISSGVAVMNGTQNNGTRLTAQAVTTERIDGIDFVVGDDISLWKFTSAGGNAYYIQDENGKYVNINGYADVSLSDSPQAITAENKGNGQVRLSANGHGLNVWGNNAAQGVTGGYWDNGGEHFTLFELNQLIQKRAEKISITDLVDKRSQQNPIKDVIIYTRIERESGDGYDYYAVKSDGSLVKIHDIGDTIGWTTLEAPGDSLSWKMTVHESGGEPNGYFDFQTMDGSSGPYLIPAPGSILKPDDPEDARDLGVNLKGWTDGKYGSTIERWDTGTNSYIGYSYDPATMKIVPYTGTDPNTKELEFLYARIQTSDPDTPAGLHTVETLDGKSKGITIKMYDFDGTRLAQNWPPRSQEMTDVMGIRSIGSTNDNGVGYANRGLVSNTLGTNGFPTAAQTGRSLGDLFNNSHFVAEADNLFVKKEYDESGYFSYDSSANYAYLDRNAGKFTLYREVAAPEMEPKGDPSKESPSAQKGNFFPFDSLENLASRNSVFDDRTVQFDGDLNRLPITHPQYGDTLYKIPNATAYPSYFFGMTMEADFYQGPGGKDNNGNDTIFEFNGDDDMWLYIDGLLALDIGGCHGAVRGTINFATGDVKVYGSRPYSTTLKDLFRDANRLPNGDPWNEAEAAKYFRGNTFADYTQHSFKMIYMERGAYASNLKVNFNLITIEPGTFVLEKKLPENVQSAYGDSVFAYQIFEEKSGQMTLYQPPQDRYVTYEDTGTRVVPDGQTDSSGFRPHYTLDGRTYDNVYFLRPDQAIVLPVEDKGTRYYVREIGIDTDIYERVTVNDSDVSITNQDTNVIPTDDLTPTYIAASSVDSVQNRGRVTYRNYPKDDHVHNLRLRKIVDSDVDDPDATFRFDVQLESNRTNELIPYNQGVYYIVKTLENGTDQYYKYEGGKLVPSPGNEPVPYKAGISGSIANISEDYTILIKGLLSGTDFKVTENQSEGEMPDGYVYVKTDVTHADDAELQGSQGRIRVYSSQQEEDALVAITNRPAGRIVVEKEWNSGDFVQSHGDIYVALYKKTSGTESAGLELVEGTARKLERNSTSGKLTTTYNLHTNRLNDYVVREVNVTLDNEGNITSVVSFVDEGGYITVTGEKTADSKGSADASDTYAVAYTQGEETDYDVGTGKTGISRTDTITNTLPKVSLRKINEVTTGDKKKYLAGAVFALEDKNGAAVTDASGKAITFTSNANGVIFENKYFSDGEYYLHEITAPDGYNLPDYRMMLTVSQAAITLKTETQPPSFYPNLGEQGTAEFSFEITNNPGAELPQTGGIGTHVIYITGLVLILGSGAMLISRRRTSHRG